MHGAEVQQLKCDKHEIKVSCCKLLNLGLFVTAAKLTNTLEMMLLPRKNCMDVG